MKLKRTLPPHKRRDARQISGLWRHKDILKKEIQLFERTEKNLQARKSHNLPARRWFVEVLLRCISYTLNDKELNNDRETTTRTAMANVY